MLNTQSKLPLQLQTICEQILPEIKEKETLSALVCGSSLQDSFWKSSLQSSGLLHLLVVSAGHLSVLFLITEVLSFSSSLQIIIGLFFAAFSGWQPPLIRAIFALLIRKTQFIKTSNQSLLCLQSGLICLALFPEWLHSKSFMMSWLAGIAVSFSQSCLNDFATGQKSAQKIFLAHFIIFALLIPMTWGLAPFHPMSIVCNFVLAPVLSALLFPLGIMIVLIRDGLPFLGSAFDLLVSLLKRLLEETQSLAPISKTSPLPDLLLWIEIIALQSSSYFIELKNKRLRD